MMPSKRLRGADRELHRDRVRAEPLADGLEAELEVRPDLVHLVDEAQTRHVVAVGLTPDGFGLGFDAFLAVEDRDGAVEHAQRSLDLDGEVDVAGGVDQVDLVGLVPWCSHGQVVAADWIVMPRSCSSSRKSMVAVPSCTSPIL